MSEWIVFVKAYSAKHGISYGEALKKAGKSYRRQSSAKGRAVARVRLKGGNAELSEDVYSPSSERKGADGWKPVASKEKSTVYEKDGKVIVAFRGSADKRDLLTDVALVKGVLKRTPRYKEEQKLVDEVIKKYGKDNVELTGHSLGGTIAKDLSRQTGVRATTYNKGSSTKDLIEGVIDRVAVKIHPKGKRAKTAKLTTNYRTAFDPVSLLGATAVNTKLVKPTRGVHTIRSFKGKGAKKIYL